MRAASRALPGPRRLPGFLILGEKRCGTTSLHRYITQHPNVLGPLAPKSTHYFDTKFGKNLDWYGSYFWPETIVEKLEEKNGPMLAGESSPLLLLPSDSAGTHRTDTPRCEGPRTAT